MLDTTRTLTAIRRSLHWLRKMLVAPDGSMGIYERYRIDIEKTNYWVRPDCTMEVARLFFAYGEYKGESEYTDMARRMTEYVLTLQRPDGWFEGSFPFYQFIPRTPDEIDIGSAEAREVTFPNDNGKVPLRLLWMYKETADENYAKAARRSLDYLMRVQAPDGTFSRNDEGEVAALKGVDFVAWPVMALWNGAILLENLKYRDAAYKGIGWISKQLLDTGRVRTSYETAQTEAWRPPSSELAIALKAYALVARYTQDRAIWTGLMNMAARLTSLQHKNGAIRDCDEESKDASQQNNPDLTDMVYTNGYALLAYQDAYRANGNTNYRDAYELLADFLIDTQCWNESPAWDGAWRGSYSLRRKKWAGRANQDNELDEGGMYSAYTGWSTAPIAYGLLRTILLRKSDYRVKTKT